MWTLISYAREGDNWSSHKEFLLDSQAEIYSEPTDQGEIAPGSLAYTQGFGTMWMKNQDGSWSEITTDDPMSVVTDVKIDGTSIVTEGVANIPKAELGKLGLVKPISDYGILINGNANLYINKALMEDINARTNQFKPVVSSNLDYAVKRAMCDGIGEAWTQAEKNGAKERLGLIGGWTEFGTYTYTREEEDPSPINVDLTGYHELCFVSDVTGTNTSNFRFMIGSNSFNIASGLCINGQRKAVFFVRESPAKLIAYDYTYGDNTGSGTLNSVGTTFKYPFNDNWADTLDQITAFTFATPANVTSYTIKIYAR